MEGTKDDRPARLKLLSFKAGVVIAVILNLAIAGSLTACHNSSRCAPLGWKNSIWPGFKNDTHWCERMVENSLIEQPANTLSNLVFIFFGFVVLLHTAQDYSLLKDPEQKSKLSNHLTLNPSLSAIYGVSMIYLGVGSLLYHAHETDETYAFDQSSIFVHFCILCGFAISLFIPVNRESRTIFICKWLTWILTFGASFGILVLHFTNPPPPEDAFIFFYIFVGFLVVAVFSSWVFRCCTKNPPTKLNIGLGFLSIGIFIAALIVQEQFVIMPCDPNSWFQFHALWHCLAATGFYVLYHMFRSDHLGIRKVLVEPQIEKELELGQEKSDVGLPEPETNSVTQSL